MLAYPHISPIALQLGPLVIRWYALAYLAGVLLGWGLVGKLNKRSQPPVLSGAAYDDIMIWAVMGIILGGRLGYVLFYKPEYYAQNPLEAFMVWHGGMSFHGGLIGMLVAMYLFCRSFKLSYMRLMDMLAVVAPIGLFFGRLANFVNGELYGRVTNSAFGMIFPDSDGLPRHPSQLYEATLEGIVLFLILCFAAFCTKAPKRAGLLSGLFLIGYSMARSTCELFREPDSFIHFLPSYITMGQLLSAPMLLLGLYLVFFYGRQRNDL